MLEVSQSVTVINLAAGLPSASRPGSMLVVVQPSYDYQLCRSKIKQALKSHFQVLTLLAARDYFYYKS